MCGCVRELSMCVVHVEFAYEVSCVKISVYGEGAVVLATNIYLSIIVLVTKSIYSTQHPLY